MCLFKHKHVLDRSALSLLSLIPPSPSPAFPSPVLIVLAEILGQTVAVVNSLDDGARLGPSQYR